MEKGDMPKFHPPEGSSVDPPRYGKKRRASQERDLAHTRQIHHNVNEVDLTYRYKVKIEEEEPWMHNYTVYFQLKTYPPGQIPVKPPYVGDEFYHLRISNDLQPLTPQQVYCVYFFHKDAPAIIAFEVNAYNFQDIHGGGYLTLLKRDVMKARKNEGKSPEDEKEIKLGQGSGATTALRETNDDRKKFTISSMQVLPEYPEQDLALLDPIELLESTVKCVHCSKFARNARTTGFCLCLYCNDCLDILINGVKITHFACRNCSMIVPVPRNGMQGFPTSKYVDIIIQILEDYKKKLPHCAAANHIDVIARINCEDCVATYCKDCWQEHKKLDEYKHHQFSWINQEHVFELQYIRSKCSVHAMKEFAHYCFSCRIPICDECLKGPHEGHKTRPLDLYANQIREKLTECINFTIKKAIQNLDVKIKALQKKNIEKSKAKEDSTSKMFYYKKQILNGYDVAYNTMVRNFSELSKSNKKDLIRYKDLRGKIYDALEKLKTWKYIGSNVCHNKLLPYMEDISDAASHLFNFPPVDCTEFYIEEYQMSSDPIFNPHASIRYRGTRTVQAFDSGSPVHCVTADNWKIVALSWSKGREKTKFFIHHKDPEKIAEYQRQLELKCPKAYRLHLYHKDKNEPESVAAVERDEEYNFFPECTNRGFDLHDFVQKPGRYTLKYFRFWKEENVDSIPKDFVVPLSCTHDDKCVYFTCVNEDEPKVVQLFRMPIKKIGGVMHFEPFYTETEIDPKIMSYPNYICQYDDNLLISDDKTHTLYIAYVAHFFGRDKEYRHLNCAVKKLESFIDADYSPGGLCVDSKNNIYVASFSENCIFRLCIDPKEDPLIEDPEILSNVRFLDYKDGINKPLSLSIFWEHENELLVIGNYDGSIQMFEIVPHDIVKPDVVEAYGIS